ncbi:TPA: ABC transporter ATP-binding protein [Streptococcus suis]
MIEMKQVYKSYYENNEKNFFKRFLNKNRQRKDVIKGIDIQIPKGKIVGLLGINGAGKTTTIRMLSTLLTPSKGEIVIDGINTNSDEKETKKKINVISGGERNLYWRLTGKENLEYFGSLYGIDKKELNNRIEECLKIVKLEDSSDVPVEKYSKGMKQRLQIAKGLINNPDYILLDEPTLGLDIVIAKELRHYVLKLAKELNKGILLTTHYLKEVEELCDYIYLLDNGTILKEGSPSEIVKSVSPEKLVKVKFGKKAESDVKEAVNKLDIPVKSIWDNDESIILKSKNNIIQEFLSVCSSYSSISIESISIVEPSLEDSLMEIWHDKY